MLSLLLRLCEYVFPERHDHKVVRLLSVNDLRSHLNPVTHDDFVFLLPFSEPMIRATIHEAKFYGNEKAWQLLGEILSQYVRHCPEETIIVPIPLSYARAKQRGFNQVEEIARQGLKRQFYNDQTLLSHKLRSDLLYRKRDTAPQTSLPRQERLKNVKDAFGIHDTTDVRGTHIILLDDVATTGATLKAAEASLRPLLPASITLLALAH